MRSPWRESIDDPGSLFSTVLRVRSRRESESNLSDQRDS